jgi:hypothetical protein
MRRALDALPADDDASSTQQADGHDNTSRKSVNNTSSITTRSEVISNLRKVLSQTEDEFRRNAEDVLRHVDNTALAKMPTIYSAVRSNDRAASLAAARSVDAQRRRRQREEHAYLSHTVGERQREHIERTALRQPATQRGREHLHRRYRLGTAVAMGSGGAGIFKRNNNGGVADARRRPIGRYGPDPGPMRPYKNRTLPLPDVASAAQRKTPHMYGAPLRNREVKSGLLSLINKGRIDRHADLSAAFAATPTAPPVLSAKPAVFYNHQSRFAATSADVAPHQFSIANLELDLTSTSTTTPQPENELLIKARQRAAAELAELDARTRSLKDTNSTRRGRYAMPVSVREVSTSAAHFLATPRASKVESEEGDTSNTSGGGSGGGGGGDDNVPSTGVGGGAVGQDDILGAYSLHQFTIRNGKAQVTTPEYVAFRRQYGFEWGHIAAIIRQLETAIRFVLSHGRDAQPPVLVADVLTVSGANVVELAEECSAAPSRDQLLKCLAARDTQGWSDVFTFQHRYTGVRGQHAAATKVQSVIRMFLRRAAFSRYLKMSLRATRIQRCWRHFAALLATRRVAERWREERLKVWRANMLRFKAEWPQLRQREKVIIHVPSISRAPHLRRTLPHLAVRENAQITRLCHALRDDPLASVVYVAPFGVTADVMQYYMKMLSVGGVSDAEERVKLLVPENFDRFPAHFSLSKLCLYSPVFLRRLKAHVRGREAYLVPGVVGDEDLQLALALDVPMLSAEPAQAALLGGRSGARRLFKRAGLRTLAHVGGIFDEDALYSALARLIVDHIDVQRWLFKIDDESGSRGVAFFEPQGLKIVAAVRGDRLTHATRWELPEVRTVFIRVFLFDVSRFSLFLLLLWCFVCRVSRKVRMIMVFTRTYIALRYII